MSDSRNLIDENMRTREQVFRILRDQILDGKWKNGEPVPPAEKMAASLHTDSATIEQVVSELETWGLVESKENGAFFRTTDLDTAEEDHAPEAYHGASLEQVMEFRRALETETAGIAALHAEKNDVLMLHKTVLDMLGAVNWKERMMADRDFHYRLALITKNPLILRTYDLMWDVLRANMIENSEKTENEKAVSYHSQIITAIADHNEEEASRLMREHLTKGLQ